MSLIRQLGDFVQNLRGPHIDYKAAFNGQTSLDYVMEGLKIRRPNPQSSMTREFNNPGIELQFNQLRITTPPRLPMITTGEPLIRLPMLDVKMEPIPLPPVTIISEPTFTSSNIQVGGSQIDKTRLVAERSTKGANAPYSLAELREFARQLGLQTTGNKEVLVERIKEHLTRMGK